MTTPAIPASALVSVVPGVISAGGTALDLNGLVLTTSTRVPIDTVAQFSSADAVGEYFGGSSQEKSIADVYFNGFDNSAAKPAALLFTQYPADAAVAAYLRGANLSPSTLTDIKALNGTVIVTVDGVEHTSGTINLSGATSFSNAAALIQSGLAASDAQVTGAIAGTTLTVSAVGGGTVAVGQTVEGTGVTAGTVITALGSGTGGTGTYTVSPTQTASSTALTLGKVTCTYDSVSGAFIIGSGMASADSAIGFASGTIAAGLKLTSATGAVTSQGADVAVPADFMDAVKLETQNWATFMTTFEPDTDGKLAFAAWTDSTTNRFAYVMWDTDASPAASNPATGSAGYLIGQADYSGTIAVWEPADLNTAAFVCGAIAATDFEQTNGRVTLAYRSQTGLVAGVTDQTSADNLIANGYNFYGSYSTANDNFTFLQRGSISGPFDWADSYVNQIWLNNQLQLALLVLLTQVGSIPYNQAGYGLLAAACADPINAAINFGAIRAGVTLSAAQIAEVNNAAGRSISGVLQTRGWYLLIQDASPQVRAARGSPPMTLWYMDGQSVQAINLQSLEVQ